MAFQEYPHDFGAITANVAAQFSIEQTFRGNPNVPWKAEIKYAVIRNNTTGSVAVNGSYAGSNTLGVGMHKRIEFPMGTRFFLVVPTATVSAGELTADVGMEGVSL